MASRRRRATALALRPRHLRPRSRDATREPAAGRIPEIGWVFLIGPCDDERVKQRTRARVREDLARLGDSKLGLAPFIDEAGRLLAQAVPHEGACWHTMDPATLIETSVHTMNLPPHGDLIAENEYLHDDYNKFFQLARATRHSGVLSEATAGDLNRSQRYRDFLHPGGILGELRASLVVDGTCWGSFAIFRAAPADFSTEERDFVHQLTVTLGRGFRAALILAGSTGTAASPAPGLIVLDTNRRVESINTTAGSWLAELGFTGEPSRDSLPHALLAVAVRATAAAEDAIARVPGASGRWVVLHASATSGAQPGRVAVIVQDAAPASIAPLIAAAYELTRRERELIELVLQGYSTSDIAARLFLSPHTVQEHLKSIFAKTGVHSRRELVGTVFLRHYQPRIHSARAGGLAARTENRGQAAAAVLRAARSRNG
jgi:DNA-binding CsgD family transcriptional regulator